MHRGSWSLSSVVVYLMVSCVLKGLVFSQLPTSTPISNASELIRQERFAEARKILEALVDNAHDPPAEVHYQLAVCDAREGRKDIADRNLDRALTRNPDHLPALHLKAYIQFSAGRYDRALEWAGRYFKRQPDGGETRKISGLARFMLGDRVGAEHDLQRAAQLLSRDFDAQYYLGRVYFERSKLTPALESFRLAIALDPHSVRARNHLGQTLEGLTRFEEAKDAYRKAINLEQQDAARSEWPYFNLGTLLLAEGHAVQAVALLEQALERNRSSLQTRTKLGVAYSAAGRPEDATEQLRQVVLAEPTNADAHYQLGRMLMRLGQEDEARRHLTLFERLRVP